MKTKFPVLILVLFTTIYSCKEPNPKPADTPKKKAAIIRNKPASPVTYHFENAKLFIEQHDSGSNEQKIVMALNRADITNLKKMDSIIVPGDTKADIAFFLPFPLQLPAANDINKIIFFSYPAQAFGAYENGELVYTGPTSMGSKLHPTPPGLYFTNWKAEKTTSTFDDEWELKWNFNIENKEGIGWHEYTMPGYPASHSCLRLLEGDARYLYTWADQWQLDKDEVKSKGTPVIVFGSYDFSAAKPWLQLVTNPHALDISAENLKQVLMPLLNEVMQAQQQKQQPVASK